MKRKRIVLPITTRDDVQTNWPYYTNRYGIVYREGTTHEQERIMRKFNNIDDDMMLFIVLKSDELVFVPLTMLVDF